MAQDANGRQASETRSNGDPRVERSKAAALEAARALLVEEGWAAVTHVRVAERSGLGRATVYRHWQSPEALLHDACQEEAEEDVRIEPTGELRADLVAALDGICYAMNERRLGNFLATLIERAEWDAQFHDIKLDLVHKGASPTEQVVADGVERGEIRSKQPIGALVAQLLGPLIYNRLMTSEPITQEFIEMIVDGFLAAHTRPSDTRPAKRAAKRRTSR